MGFVSGMKDIDTLLGEWAGALDATPDWTLVDNQVAPYGGVALQHVSGYYLILKKGYYRTDDDNSYYYGAGIQVAVSSDYDLTNHTWAGSYQVASIPIYEKNNTNTPAWVGYADDFVINYMDSDDFYEVVYWVDKYGIVGVLSTPFNSPYTGVTVGAFFAIEVIPVSAREYNDGLTDFFVTIIPNYSYRDITNTANPDTYGCFKYLRPFNLSTVSRCYDVHERYAFKSLGNGKVYFEFLYYFNDTARNTVAAQTKRWFLIDDVNTAGIAKGDIINWIDNNAGVTRQFYVAQAWSQQRSEVVNVAIPYSNAYEY